MGRFCSVTGGSVEVSWRLGRRGLPPRLRGLWMLVGLALLGPIVPVFAVANDVGGDRIEEIVVTATRTQKALLDVPAAITKQDMEELRRLGFTFGTDEFRGVPGVNFRRNEGDGDEFTSVTIRGITGNHGNDTFLAMIDGMPFIGPDEEVLMTEIPFDVVDSVEIVRGPVSALYGRGALAGAVNYRTRRPSGQSRFAVRGDLGSDDYRRGAITAEGGSSTGAAWLANVAYEKYEGWRARSERERLNVYARFVYPLADSTTLDGSVVYFDRDSEQAGVLPLSPTGEVLQVAGGRSGNINPTDTYNESKGWLAAVRLDHVFSDVLSAALVTQARRFDSDNRFNFYNTAQDASGSELLFNGFTSAGTTDVLFLEPSVSWAFGRHAIVAGASFERSEMDEVESWFGQFGFTFACGFAFFEWRVDRLTGDILNADHPCQVGDTPLAIVEAKHDFWGAFLQDEIELADRWTLTLGARYDRFERSVDFASTGPFDPGGKADERQDAWSPKGALSYTLGDGQVYVAYGRGFGSNFGPVWQWAPNRYTRDSRPTTIDSLEVGWKSRLLGRRLEVEIIAFGLEQKNRPVLIANPDPMGPPNLMTTGREYQSTGVETAFRYLAGNATNVWGAYAYLDPKWKRFEVAGASDTVDLSNNRPTGVPRHTASVGVEHAVSEHLSLRGTYEYYGDYAISGDNSINGGGYQLVNAGASFALSRLSGWSIDAVVSNAFDKSYRFEFGNVGAATHATPGPPRQFRLTLKGEF